jgi:hypothetical protein
LEEKMLPFHDTASVTYVTLQAVAVLDIRHTYRLGLGREDAAILRHSQCYIYVTFTVWALEEKMLPFFDTASVTYMSHFRQWR